MTSLARWTLLGLALGSVFAVVWWLLLEPLSQEDYTTELVIPAGTARAVAAGRTAPFIPDRINLSPGGELRVVNKDSVEHRVGGFRIPAESETVIKPQVDVSKLVCSLHPSGALDVGSAGRPAYVLMALPVIVIAIPFGLVCWFATMIGSRLDMGPGTEPG